MQREKEKEKEADGININRIEWKRNLHSTRMKQTK